MTIPRRTVLAILAASGFATGALAAAAQSGAPVIGKIALADQRVWVAVKIGASEPVLFIIDTGGFVNLIDEAFADSLNLRAVGRTSIKGIGGVISSEVVVARNVNVGGRINLSEAAFSKLKIKISRDAMGSLAADMLTSMDSELDFEALEWRVWPNGRPDRDGYLPVKSDIDRSGRGASLIYAETKVNGQAFDLLVDTGAPQNLMLGSKATERSGLWDDSKPYVPMKSRGIGGQAKLGRLVRASTVQFSDVTFNRPLINLQDPRLVDQFMRSEGIIGLNLLRHTTISTDVKGSRIWTKRNNLAPLRVEYPMSGLWLDEKGKTLVVADVGTGSPAAAVGIRRGDEVVGETLQSAIQKIVGPPGAEVTLQVKGASGLSQKSFILKPYL